jgi:hypothetical protein
MNSLLSPYFWLPPTCSVDVQWTGSLGYVFPFPWLYHTFYSVSYVRDTDEDHSFGESNVLICCYLSRVTDAMGSPRLLMRQTWIIGTVWIIQISDAHTWTQLNYFNIYICTLFKPHVTYVVVQCMVEPPFNVSWRKVISHLTFKFSDPKLI